MSVEDQDTEIIKYKLCGCVQKEYFPMKFPPYPVETEINLNAQCARCSLAKALERDVNAQSYLTRKMIERFNNSPVERFRRWSHNQIHALHQLAGFRNCLVCDNRSDNRLYPIPLDHVRPAAFYLNGR